MSSVPGRGATPDRGDRVNRRAGLSSVLTLLLGATGVSVAGAADSAPLSVESQACLDCREGLNPGLVSDWRSGRHAKTTPGEAVNKPRVERRVSAESVPEDLRSVAVGYYECHGLNPATHQDNFEHFCFNVNVGFRGG